MAAQLLPQLDHAALYQTLIWQEGGNGNWNAEGSPNTKACGTVVNVFRCPSMAMPLHIDNEGIPGRVPQSYLGVASSQAAGDEGSDIPSGIGSTVALADPVQDGMLYGCSSVRFRDVTDGLSNTFLVGETYTSMIERNGLKFDHWYFGAPQTGWWTPGDPTCGSNSCNEFSEVVGSAFIKLNAALDASVHGNQAQIAFGSYHTGGAHLLMADGAVRFISENISAGFKTS